MKRNPLKFMGDGKMIKREFRDYPKRIEYAGHWYRIHPINGHYLRTQTLYLHREVWEKANGKIPKGYVIHHKNNLSFENNIENLEMMTQSEHLDLHWNRGNMREEYCF